MIVFDEAILRKKCENVEPKEVEELRNLLEKELINSAKLGFPGLGLACPQINIHKKMAIVRLGRPELSVDLINCKIEKGYDEAIFNNEGCLSFPGQIEKTKRFQEIHVSDNLIFPHRFICTGLLSVVVQHELDHLNGILLSDRAIKKQQGPNELCACGSLKKYKRCHGKVES